jgi:acetyl esterase/lipase
MLMRTGLLLVVDLRAATLLPAPASFRWEVVEKVELVAQTSPWCVGPLSYLPGPSNPARWVSWDPTTVLDLHFSIDAGCLQLFNPFTGAPPRGDRPDHPNLPVNHIAGDAPPTLILHGEGDTSVPCVPFASPFRS